MPNRPHTTRYISMPSDPDDLRGMQKPLYLNSSTLPPKKKKKKGRDEIMTQSPQGCTRGSGLVNLKGFAPCLEETKPVDGTWGSLWTSRTTIRALVFTAHSHQEHPQRSEVKKAVAARWWTKVWTMCALLTTSWDPRIPKASICTM